MPRYTRYSIDFSHRIPQTYLVPRCLRFHSILSTSHGSTVYQGIPRYPIDLPRPKVYTVFHRHLTVSPQYPTNFQGIPLYLDEPHDIPPTFHGVPPSSHGTSPTSHQSHDATRYSDRLPTVSQGIPTEFPWFPTDNPWDFTISHRSAVSVALCTYDTRI